MSEREREYLSLVTALDNLVVQCQTIGDAHEDCPGCQLCLDAAGIAYTVEGYRDVVRADTPERLLTQLDRGGDTDAPVVMPAPDRP